MVNPVPSAYRGVTAYLILKDAARAYDFYQKAFGAEPLLRLDGPDGRIAHAEVRIAGGTVQRAVQDQFYGDRSGTLTDPFGIQWTVATHIEDVTEEEVKRRMAKMMSPS